MVVKTEAKFTNLKLSRDCHKRAKSSATMIGEEFYEFVETAINERIDKLKKAGRLTI